MQSGQLCHPLASSVAMKACCPGRSGRCLLHSQEPGLCCGSLIQDRRSLTNSCSSSGRSSRCTSNSTRRKHLRSTSWRQARRRVRGEAVAELTNHHSNTLESLLAVLRNTSVDDRASRQTVTNLAAEATAHLRTATDRVRAFTEEPVTTAFERLRGDLRPLVRYRDIGMQFVEPPADGRALPSEVAHGARAVVSGAILALVDQASVTRVRAVWDCDGKNLLVNVRDHGPGDLSTESVQLQPLRQRVAALEASCRSPQPRAGGRRCR